MRGKPTKSNRRKTAGCEWKTRWKLTDLDWKAALQQRDTERALKEACERNLQACNTLRELKEAEEERARLFLKARKDKVLASLRLLQFSEDTSSVHREADDILVDFINDEEITEAYEAVEKWYE